MNTTLLRRLMPCCLCLLALTSAATVHADPLPGRDVPKFSQKPMIATQILNDNGVLDTYYGHDQLSTAYGFPGSGPNIPIYQGRFIADDFADMFSSPVVHVKWWGSYFNDFVNPTMPVNRFLISFESDIPQSPGNPFSRPGDVKFNQVVLRDTDNNLSPGGEFSEKVIRGPDPLLGESLYEYNAELHLDLPFPQKPDTVYWLKIVAMVDVPVGMQFDPYNPSPQETRWGWHNRDYTQQNLLASPNVAGPPFPPGEAIVGQVGPAVAPTPVWHFQDNAVSGDVRIQPGPNGYIQPLVFQPFQNMAPTHYMDLADGPGLTPNGVNIGSFSKDLAFELFTIVPEPASCILLVCGMAGALLRRP